MTRLGGRDQGKDYSGRLSVDIPAPPARHRGAKGVRCGLYRKIGVNV